MKKSILSLACLLLLAGCAETQFAANIGKQMGGNERSQGGYKVGKPYDIGGVEYYPEENFEYSETGIASWYGPGFHGGRTANGETFNTGDLTAAHRTLQMPSLVRVTNLENGRAVVVRVNDRGPYSKGRIIDVSSRAADLLGFKGRGTAKVRVETLPAESRRIAEDARAGRDTRGYEIALNGNQQPANPNATVMLKPADTVVALAAPPSEAAAAGLPPVTIAPVEKVALDASRLEPVAGNITPDGRFMPAAVVTHEAVKQTSIFVQAGSFGNPDNANRLAKTLQGFGPTQVKPALVNGSNFYRVRLGPFATVEQADSALASVISGPAPQAKITVE